MIEKKKKLRLVSVQFFVSLIWQKHKGYDRNLSLIQNNPEYCTQQVPLLNNKANGRNALSFPVPHRNVASRKTEQKKIWLATCTWKPKFPGSIPAASYVQRCAHYSNLQGNV